MTNKIWVLALLKIFLKANMKTSLWENDFTLLNFNKIDTLCLYCFLFLLKVFKIDILTVVLYSVK